MRRKSLWKNLMLATALTVVLGTAPVTAFAADVDSTVTEAEQTTPQADTTVKEEVAEPEVKAITVDRMLKKLWIRRNKLYLYLYIPPPMHIWAVCTFFACLFTYGTKRKIIDRNRDSLGTILPKR